MAFFSRTGDRHAPEQRPPLHDYDLDALSDDELEALLFDGEPPEDTSDEKTSWRSGKAWKFAAFATVMAGIVFEGDLVGPMILFVALFYFFWKSDSGERFSLPSFSEGSSRAAGRSNASLTRSATDKKLMGVCGGLAEYFGLGATFVRFAFIVGLLVTGGAPVGFLYLGLACFLPAGEPYSASAEERLRILRDS